MGGTRYRWYLAGLLVTAMLLPIWIGRYAPLYDYPNHLLEAQIVAHYDQPQLAYANSYDIVPDWYLRSNALATLFLIGLGSFMPMALAGHLVLSLYLVLFVGGVGLLLQQRKQPWPLLLLAAPLTYNYGFTSGWINFSYGAALSLYALVVYLQWQEQDSVGYLILLALLTFVIYIAHLIAWALLLSIIAALSAGEAIRLRRHGRLMLAMNSAFLLLLITRPALALVGALIGPTIWTIAELARRLHLSTRVLVLSGLGVALVGPVITKVFRPLLRSLDPQMHHFLNRKLQSPFELLTLPHQFLPPNPLLTIYNGILLVLILALGVLLAWSTLHQANKDQGRWLAASGLLLIIYVYIPSDVTATQVIEPRVLLFGAFVGLASAQLPAINTWPSRLVTTCTVTISLLSLVGTFYYSSTYNQQAQALDKQLSILAPARNLLVLQGQREGLPNSTVIHAFNSFYNGIHYSTTYTLDHGGFVPRVFPTGPVRPKSTVPALPFTAPGFNNTRYVAEHCYTLRGFYDAVVVWGQPTPEAATALKACFIPGPPTPDISIWWRDQR